MADSHLIVGLIPHIFHTLKLPNQASDNLIEEENYLLSLMRKTIQEHHSIPQILETRSLFDKWMEMVVDSYISAEKTSNVIRNLQPGQLLAIYVRAQNCGLLISIPKLHPNDIIWSTFPVSNKNNTVTESMEDLLVSYPATSIEVKRADVLHSIAFAEQLNILIGTEFQDAISLSQKAGEKVEEIRDVNTTTFISGWLPAMLVTNESKQSFGDIPPVEKKIRDSVIIGKAPKPFRRSGMWTTIKVVLNISLVRDLDAVRGRFLYKVIILRFMLRFLQSKMFPADESTGIEMLKKVGRRINKLEKFVAQHKIMGHAEVYATLLSDANKIVTDARNKIDRHWKSIIDNAKKRSIILTTGAPFNISQSLSGNGLLDYLTRPSVINGSKCTVSIPHVPPRHRISLYDKYTHSFDQSETSMGVMLFDFERNVRENWSNIITSSDYEYVWMKTDKYLCAAMGYYGSDPVGMSRAIVTILQIIKVWDHCVCKEYPLLRSYKIGIKTDFIRTLLVVTKDELEIVNTLETYFLSRDRAPNSCLLEEAPHRDSFSVRFAEQSSEMESLREKILQEGTQRAQDKIKAVEAAKLYCASLRAKMSRMNHDYCENYNYRSWCELCRLTREEQNYRVTVYEKPLPEDLHKQRAVVFELIIPSSIACLRDLLYIFVEKIAKSVSFGNGVCGQWSEDDQLRTHARRQIQWKINLGSTTRHFVDTHYSQLHPSRPICDFIVNNGYNTFHAANRQTVTFSDPYGGHIKNWCTLKVASNSSYSSMQWAVNGKNQTPNEVMARQSECHRDISTSEFVEFGSLRCYDKLQIRNLIKATVLGTLSFKRESVFNLICQSLWECSPRINKNGIRDAHEDFTDTIFLLECLKIMENLVEKHKDNWQDHYIILTAIVFALNVAEKSDDERVVYSVTELILKCRDFTETWSEAIQNIMSKMTNADVQEKQNLTLKFVEVNICRAFTFGAHKRLRGATFTTSNHIKNWLQSIVIVFDNYEFVKKNSSQQILSLVRRVIEMGVDVEGHLTGLSDFHRGINTFLRSHYGGAENLDFSNETKWHRYEEAEQVYFVELNKRESPDEKVILQLDIVTGNFLVNGCKVSRLPEAMENHEDFRRVFPTMSFEVQPLGPNEAVTKHAYEGSYYSFVLNGKTLIVEEIISGTDNRRTLIPSKYLPTNFPHKFEHKFTHWLNRKTKTVEFFPRDTNEPLKIMGKQCELVLNVANDCRLQHLETKRLLVDIRCPTFRQVANIFSRLETAAHIHVWLDTDDNKYTVELPRMRLSFVVTGFNKTIVITSQEYEGMVVAEQQQLDTLIGLEQGLLLTNGIEKMLFVPHGNVTLKNHHSISISTDRLLEPPYFRYDVDDRLGQLKPGETQTGWFYLAYLHAVTSSFIPDPLTGVTGTERAFQLLNSGVCFPSEPFSQCTIRIIQLLRELAPTRKYYPKHIRVMETVAWPPSIWPLAAHDNFVDIINNIAEKHNRLIFLFNDAKKIDCNDKNPDLRRKAAWRRAIISNGINGSDATYYGLSTPSAEEFTYGTEGVKQTIRISELCHLGAAELPNTDVLSLLSCLLLNKNVLSAGFDMKDSCDRDVRDWMSVDFTNSWLGLYMAARDVKRHGQTHDWIMFLSCLAFRENGRVSVDDLSILSAISLHPEKFVSVDPPPHGCYTNTSETEYDATQIETILSTCVTTTFEDYKRGHNKPKYITEDEFAEQMKTAYESERNADLNALKNAIRRRWPCETCDLLSSTQYYDWSKAHDHVNNLFTRWYRNRELHSFISRVSLTIQGIQGVCNIYVPQINASKLVASLGDANGQFHSVKLASCLPTRVRLNNFVANNFDNVMLERCERLFCGNGHDFGDANGQFRSVELSSRLPKRVRLNNFVANNFDNVMLERCERLFCGNGHDFPLTESNDSQIFNEFIKDLRNSWFQWNQLQSDTDTGTIHPQSIKNCSSAVIWNHICESIKKNSEISYASDWFPRLTPTTLLPLICDHFRNETAMCNLQKLLGGFAVTLTNEQQQSRIKRYERHGNDLNLLEMKREISNIGHTNWSPKSHPEWLLLEIENDFLIRPLQIKVAQQMQNPHKGRNSLMQMNMGEGKTAVIIPLLSLALADGSRLCRITVLRSLYQINLKSLSLKIGGLLLNRRVYTMPCRRDYPIVTNNVNLMKDAYLECVRAKGVLLTLSEHRLSFELKKHEKALAGSESDSNAIDGILKWLQANARDVLDESDEILQAKYQLLYTLGEPLTKTGGSLRWTIAQKMLKLLPKRIKLLLNDDRLKNQLELNESRSEQEFPHCRVLSENAYKQLCASLGEDVIANGLIPEPLPTIKSTVVKFLTQEIVSADEMKEVYESSSFSLPTQKDTLLLVRGLLACGVLRSTLSKRWRVNYGVNPTGHRKMAVPFRAKDVAADRAEFGHPDVAIVLTLLSYYYAGLSNEQLEDTFARLFKLNFAEEEYQSWVALLPSTTRGLTSIKNLSGINLQDYRQKYDVLFPAFKRNMATIDFWLGQAVFPVESKQFGSKIGCSAWDLCRDNTTHPTTGFSGTNDTKLLLPRTIQQRDMPELLGTNGKVLANLLRPENNHYEGLSSHISASNIIRKMVQENVRVLLDVGAIMLELCNEGVADEWMKQCPKVEAVVFFDSKDHLLVKARQAPRPIQFETSPFRNRLDCCAIYLDEIHTRGTDMKIPLDTTAVVTLGKGVRKDTLAQGCMRMRKLGQGHTIRFWGSSEVHPQILAFSPDGRVPGSYEVLQWAIQNSVQFLEEGFIHWAGSGMYELQKRSAGKICDANESKLLAQLCSQNEVLELMSMYGSEKSFLTYPSIVKNMIARTIEHFRSNLIDSTHDVPKTEILRDSEGILQHIERYVGKLQRMSNILDEEQERELEHELEEETEIEPPPPAVACKHVLNQRLRAFIKTGGRSALDPLDLLPLHKAFINSELRHYCQTADAWGQGSNYVVRATVDFERTVVQTFNPKSNDFLRPVMWIYNTLINGVNFAILMSPFEVNEMWNEFKGANGALHMFSPRLFSDQENLHDSGPMMVPSRRGTHSIFPNAMTATLDIMAGSFYFGNDSDERWYCCVAGISPKPRGPDENRLFQNGGIVNGFVDKMQRNTLPMYAEVTAFDEHPEALIRGIIEARHGTFSDKSHVGNVIIFGRKNFSP